jgi:hypothetical protein
MNPYAIESGNRKAEALKHVKAHLSMIEKNTVFRSQEKRGSDVARIRDSYMKMPTDFWAMSRKSRGKMPMWKRAHRLMMITTE